MNKQSKTHLIVDLADCKEFISAAGLNEKQCRLFYGFLSSEIGGERQAVLAKTLGVSLQTVKKGKSEFSQKESVNTHRIRKAGAGRKKIAEQCPEFQRLLVSLLEPPELSGCALVWTTLSLRKIQAIAKGQNISVSHSVISKEIAKAGFLKKSHHKMLQVLKASPSREEQFAFINEEIKKYIAEGQPVISINCEKQEIKDSFKVCGTDVPKKSFDETAYEEAVNQASNIALYRLFSDDKTEEFAAQGCYGWWKIIGEKNYPGAHKFLIICAGRRRDRYQK